ncbi:MAG: sulfate adenylyltransferase subunit 1 [Solirubrobacteraceae bacterium]
MAGLDLLRFTTAGSVDDGKSTLIGRLLYDSKQLLEDQLEHVTEASRRRGGDGALDLALLTDGLRAEREQGITIDVAYRYFATERRRFIIADTPGHQQYTRNMVCGASTADLAVVLLDARRGPLEQSKRHAFISALLGIPHLVVAVNKMDLVDFEQATFEQVRDAFVPFLGGFNDVEFIPISALDGDNVVERSQRMDWYQGPALLSHLERVEVSYDHPHDVAARMPVQWVVRPAVGDYRGYAGQIASGALHPGEEVVVLPGGQRTRIAAIDSFEGKLDEAIAPLSVTLRLADQIDVSRGDMICAVDAAPTVARELTADVCWMADAPLRAGNRYELKQTSRALAAIVDEVSGIVDMHSFERTPAAGELALNDIGRVRLRTSSPLAFDPYRINRRTGSFILIDTATDATVGAGMIC